ncbi:MAG: LysM peptidoglycan-binding domain-containing protein [Bdellovibrionia bacterium]
MNRTGLHLLRLIRNLFLLGSLVVLVSCATGEVQEDEVPLTAESSSSLTLESDAADGSSDQPLLPPINSDEAAAAPSSQTAPQASSDQATSDQATSDQATSDQATSDQATLNDAQPVSPVSSSEEGPQTSAQSAPTLAQDSSISAASGPVLSGDSGTYQVIQGDTLMKIAFKLWGDPFGWRKLYQQNRSIISNPDLIYPGAQLTYSVPLPDQKNQPNPGRPYLVKKGDTLLTISQQVYGTAKKWKHLLNHNKNAIRNPEKIIVGITLYYSDAPAFAQSERKNSGSRLNTQLAQVSTQAGKDLAFQGIGASSQLRKLQSVATQKLSASLKSQSVQASNRFVFTEALRQFE